MITPWYKNPGSDIMSTTEHLQISYSSIKSIGKLQLPSKEGLCDNPWKYFMECWWMVFLQWLKETFCLFNQREKQYLPIYTSLIIVAHKTYRIYLSFNRFYWRLNWCQSIIQGHISDIWSKDMFFGEKELHHNVFLQQDFWRSMEWVDFAYCIFSNIFAYNYQEAPI